MNSDIIPQGPTETITFGAATLNSRPALLVEAITDIIITTLAYQFQATPASSGVTSSFTLKAGSHLFNVKSITFTGTATFYYRV